MNIRLSGVIIKKRRALLIALGAFCIAANKNQSHTELNTYATLITQIARLLNIQSLAVVHRFCTV